MATVLVIGLGAMGGTMARRLVQSGVDVTGYDVSQAAIDRFVSTGGKSFSNLSESIQTTDTIITSLPNDEILLNFVRENLVEHLRPEQSFIEMSTILPQTMMTIAAELQGKVREIVDAPVSGGPNEAMNQKLSILIGVDGDLKASTRDLLRNLGTVHLIGKVGNGKAMKLVNNTMSLGNTAVFSEAFQLGHELGLDYQAMYNVVSKGSGGSSIMFNKRIPYVLDDDFHARFSVDLAEKDTGLALRMAHEQKFSTPILANVHQRYEEARRRGLGQEDIIALVKLYR